MTSTRSWLGRLQSAEGPLLIGAVTAAISSRVGPSWDEAYWLAIGRMVESGRVLYEGAIDNKSPLIHMFVWIMDRLPGSYPQVRGVFLGLLVGVTIHLGLALSPLVARGSRILFSSVVGVWLMVMTDLVFTTEICAVLLFTASIFAATRSRTWWAVGLALMAAGCDFRAILLIPAVVLASPVAIRLRVGMGLGISVMAATAIVLAVPHLSYALIELSFASRGEGVVYPTSGVLRSLLEAALPLVGTALVFRVQRISNWATWTLVGAVVIGLVSGRPYSHYWLYLVVVLFGLAAELRSKQAVRTAAAAIAASLVFIPAFDTTRLWLSWQESVRARAERVAAAIASTESVIVFDSLPFLAPHVADQLVLRAPSVEYLAWTSSLTSRYRAEIPALVAQADVIVDQGLLFAPPDLLQVRYRDVQILFAGAATDFVCVVTVEGFTLRRRPPCREGAETFGTS